MLDASTSAFTTRKEAQASRQLPGSFCEFLARGEVWVGTPGSDALCRSLADDHSDRLSHSWATKVAICELCPGTALSPTGVLVRHMLK